MADLTDDERAELENLRAEKASKPADVPAEDTVTLPPTHWLHLADGNVIETNGVKSHHEGIPVIGAYEKPQELVSPPAERHVF